jgi:hypothetical protein
MDTVLSFIAGFVLAVVIVSAAGSLVYVNDDK